MQIKSLQLITLALASHTTFKNSEVKDEIESLITALDTDLYNVGYTESEEMIAAQESLEDTLNEVAAIEEGDALLSPNNEDEEEDEEVEDEEDEEDEDEFGEEFGVEDEDEEVVS